MNDDWRDNELYQIILAMPVILLIAMPDCWFRHGRVWHIPALHNVELSDSRYELVAPERCYDSESILECSSWSEYQR